MIFMKMILGEFGREFYSLRVKNANG